jgi:phosphomannomutase
MNAGDSATSPRTTVDASIFKAYDVRGTYPDQIGGETAYLIGRAFARVLAERYGLDAAAGLKIGLGRDMRLSAPELSGRYRDGLVDEGCEVLDVGQVGSEMLYWIVNRRELDGGLMCTASHNPARYTGAKLVARKAIPLSGDAGIQEIRQTIEAGMPEPAGGGGHEATDIYAEFHEHALSFVDAAQIGGSKVVCDGGNGMAGPMIGPILERLGLELDLNYWTPNGEFPDHEPNPLLEENRKFIIDRVRETGAELGIAWDGDADRCFFIDETGEFVDGDFLTALLAESVLRKNPGATILYDVRASRAVADTVIRAGGKPLINRVGHAFFKARMHEVPESVFGGEVSGHYYFRQFGCVDSGTLPALLILELLAQEGKTLGELLAPFRERYFITGEINSEVSDPQAVMDEIERRYGDGEITKLDGVSVDYDDWHFNVRPSNTEPLLRLNLEAFDAQTMAARRDEVLALIRG